LRARWQWYHKGMATAKTAQTITCRARLFSVGSWTIFRLPAEASAQLPSRGQVMVSGSLDGLPLQTPLEPDGNFSHWFRVDERLRKAAHAAAGDTVSLVIEPMKDWPEPPVPADLRRALAGSPPAHDLWQRVTPMARWEWIRWIRSTGKEETRQRRVEVAISKLKSGERRPCCWNRNLCTEPTVSKNGALLEPAPPTK